MLPMVFSDKEKEELKRAGVNNLSEVIGNSLSWVENLYGHNERVHTEYDLQPEDDPIISGISKRVAILLTDGRVLHDCYYVENEDQWYYLGKIVRKSFILRWWYEEDRFFEI